MSEGSEKVEKDPIVYHFTLQRRTSDDEQITVQFNGHQSESKEAIENKMNLLGDILHARMAHHNQMIVQANEESRKVMMEKKQTVGCA